MIPLGKNAALWQNQTALELQSLGMQKAEYLFVYGTLRTEVKNPISWVLTRYGTLIGKATLWGKLYDLGSYPGVVLSDKPSDMVEGELYRLRDKDKVFEVLDPYEGYDPEEVYPGEFRREKIPILLKDGEQVHGWVYLYCRTTEGLKRISSGDYLSYRSRKSKARKL